MYNQSRICIRKLNAPMSIKVVSGSDCTCKCQVSMLIFPAAVQPPLIEEFGPLSAILLMYSLLRFCCSYYYWLKGGKKRLLHNYIKPL